MVKRSTTSHRLSSLRAAVVGARDAFAPGGPSRHLTSVKVPLDKELLLPSGEILSTVMCLIAVKILTHSGGIERLSGQGEIGVANLGDLSRQLQERVAAFCPQLLKTMAPPTPPSQLLLETVWERLSAPHLSVHWQDERSLGDAYHFLCAPLRRASQNEIQSANKSVGLDGLVAFTQLYTPGWVVAYLLEHTLLPQWSGHPGTAGSRTAAELALLDPACGSGHFLIPAFDCFLKMHAAEGTPPSEAVAAILTHNLAGVDIDNSALWVVALALFLKSLKAGGADRTEWRGVASVLATGNGATSSLLGTLDPSWSKQPHHPLARRYNAVVTNPPYTGRKLLPRELKAQLKALYPHSHQDLCAAFIQRGLELVEPGGRLGFIGQASLMHLPTYQDLRRQLAEQETIVSIVDAGPGVFPLQTGEKVNSALVVVKRSGAPVSAPLATPVPAVFIDITTRKDKESALCELAGSVSEESAESIYHCNPRSFKLHPRYAFAYRCPSVILDMVHSTEHLDAYADVRQGLATTDNKRFVRYWWDVDTAQRGTRWFPYVKGAGSDRWYSPIMHVVNWANDGAEIKAAVADSYPYLDGKTGWVVKNEQFYFQDGLTFSFVNSKALAVRKLPSGCIFDVGGSALFGDGDTLDLLFAYLNSSILSAIARVLNPTINFQVGDVRRLPVIAFPQHFRSELAQLGQECYRLKRELQRFDPTSVDAVVPKEVLDIASGADIGHLFEVIHAHFDGRANTLTGQELRVNEIVLDAFMNLARADASAGAIKRWIDRESPVTKYTSPFSSRAEFAEIVIEFLVRLCLERQSSQWDQPASCQAPQPVQDAPVTLPAGDNDEIARLLGLTAASRAWLEQQLDCSIGRFLSQRFTKKHAKRFHGNPLFFTFCVPEMNSILVASSRIVRRCGTKLTDHALRNPAERSVLETIATRLQSIPDWTGADLLGVLTA